MTDPELTALKALLQLREDVKDWIDIQAVAFPQDAILPFLTGPALLERALAIGADASGGIAHMAVFRTMKPLARTASCRSRISSSSPHDAPSRWTFTATTFTYAMGGLAAD